MCNCGRRRIAGSGIIRTRGPVTHRRGVMTQMIPESSRAAGGYEPTHGVRLTEPSLFNGMVIRDTSEWGPLLWTVMHSLAEIGGSAIADSDWAELFVALHTSLPCPDCTAHYTTWLAAHPPSTTGARMWLLDLHNDVNQRKGVAVWTEAEIAAAYAGANKTTLTTQVERLRALIGVGAVTVLARMVAALP